MVINTQTCAILSVKTYWAARTRATMGLASSAFLTLTANRRLWRKQRTSNAHDSLYATATSCVGPLKNQIETNELIAYAVSAPYWFSILVRASSIGSKDEYSDKPKQMPKLLETGRWETTKTSSTSLAKLTTAPTFAEVATAANVTYSNT